MKTEIGGTFKWSEEQIKVYAAAFREGDAVSVGGELCEVCENQTKAGLWQSFGHGVVVEGNVYRLNFYDDDAKGGFEGVVDGFEATESVKSPYNIITPKDYEVQEGDKLVWLGEGYEHWVFGRSYTVEMGSCGRLVVIDEDGLERLPKSESWGVIPRYENVKEENSMDNKNEHSENTRTFKVGDRVRVTGGYYNGWEGSISQSREVGGENAWQVLFSNGRGYRWVEEELLELVEKLEKSPEQEAFEYLLTLDKTLVRIFLTDEINDWTKEFMRQKDYNSAKQAIEILEKLEESE